MAAARPYIPTEAVMKIHVASCQVVSMSSMAGAVMNMNGSRKVRMSSEKARHPVLIGSERAMQAAA